MTAPSTERPAPDPQPTPTGAGGPSGPSVPGETRETGELSTAQADANAGFRTGTEDGAKTDAGAGSGAGARTGVRWPLRRTATGESRSSRAAGAKVSQWWLRLVALAVLGVLWQITAVVMDNPAFIPAPAAVWHRLIQTSTVHDGVRGYSGHLLIEHLGVSLRRILIGSAIGVAGGLLVGVVMGTVTWVRVVTEPVVTFVRALPPLAYFSLFIIWFGIDETPKLWLLSIAALPPVAVATASAVQNAPAALVEAVRALGAGRWESIRDVVLPSALPEILTGIRLAVGIAYSSVVAAETINGVPGIGGMVRDAQRYSQTDVVVLGLFAIGLSGLVIDAALRVIETRLIPWRGRA